MEIDVGEKNNNYSIRDKQWTRSICLGIPLQIISDFLFECIISDKIIWEYWNNIIYKIIIWSRVYLDRMTEKFRSRTSYGDKHDFDMQRKEDRKKVQNQEHPHLIKIHGHSLTFWSCVSTIFIYTATPSRTLLSVFIIIIIIIF